eukprot:753684-Hanusia_phi.AAC.3
MAKVGKEQRREEKRREEKRREEKGREEKRRRQEVGASSNAPQFKNPPPALKFLSFSLTLL